MTEDNHALTESAVIDLAIESWRFGRLFLRVLGKLDAGDATRYESQLRYFVKKLQGSLEQCGLRLVNLEGQLFDPGMAATALNVGDFGPEDRLFVDQMLEPVIIGPNGLRRAGVVILKKVDA